MAVDFFARLWRWVIALFQKGLPSNDQHKQIHSKLVKFSHLSVPEIIAELKSDEKGLTLHEARERLHQYGLNEIAHEKPPVWYILFLKNFTNPFIALLLILACISWFIGDMDAVIIISVMVAISVLMRFIQELRSNFAAEKLKALVSTKATVLRRKNADQQLEKIEIDIKNLVPGDIIQLSAGDLIPADVRLLQAKDLYISQASLTGESLPVEKDESFLAKESNNPLEQPNMCFMGTDVLNGAALAIVIATGSHTYFGSVAKVIAGYRPMTSFDLGVNKVTWLLIRFMLIMVPFVFFINGFTKGNWLEAFLFSLSVAVGLTPEMLPMIVTANLAKGAMAMSRSKVIVKRLNAIQNFGAMNILCTDKTGTLTQDRVILDRYLNVDGEEDQAVLAYGYLNSHYQTGLKNLLDVAVLQHSEIKQMLHLDKEYRKVDEIPFDFNRRRMTVIVEKEPQNHLLICKGAVEEILGICTEAKMGGQIVPLTDEIKQKITDLKKDLNDDGMRVLALAYKEIKDHGDKEYRLQDEQQLVILGVLAFLDPPKLSASLAIQNLRKYQVDVKILTGDNELVTRRICKWVNLEIQGILRGDEIEEMSDSDLQKEVEKTTIFAKLSPLQKSRVISILKKNGHTVGYLGDGINDAAALREADIGISVDTAVDIAKESADIIMLEKSLLFLGEGVLEGRKTFGNIIKYIKMAVSSNFGNVFSILGASAFLPFLPMMPIQLLIQNLLYDLSQTTIPFDNVDKEFLLQPRKWEPGGIRRFMIFIGPISSIFDYTTFALMWFVFQANTVGTQALFQSGWFIEGLLSQTLIVHMIRTQKIPFFQSIASLPLLLTTFIIMAIGIYIPYSGIGKSIGLVPLPEAYFPWLLLTLLSYCVLTQFVKIWFIKRFRYWL
jgi:Mg2+-importing ATPase